MRHQKILVIDDEADIRDLLAVGLETLDLEVLTAENGETGFRQAQEESVELILLDICLPDINGLDLCHRLKEDPVTHAIPVILMTGKHTTDDKLKGFQLGALDYINKPFNFAELQERIKTILQQKSLARKSETTAQPPAWNPQTNAVIGQAVDASSDAICITDAHGNAVYQNRAFHRAFNVDSHRLLSHTEHQALYARPKLWDRIWATCRAGAPWRGEVPMRIDPEQPKAHLCRADPIWSPANRFNGVIAIYTDIAQLKRLEEDLTHQATHDMLTDVYNRRFFTEILNQGIAKAQRGQRIALLYLDLDNFKLINDTFGHEAGDRLLREVSELLRHQTREMDYIARLGGDEFAVLLEDTDGPRGIEVAERILRAFRESPYFVGDHTVTVSVSIGLAPIVGKHTSETICSRAETACYLAKQKGKDGYVLYQEEDQEVHQFTQEVSWSMQIDEAFQNNQFEVWLQPIVSLKSHEGSYFEALLRMRTEEGTVIFPHSIIPAAERFGKILQIDRFMVQAATGFLAAHPDVRISVNLSAQSLNNPRLPHLIERILKQSDPVADRLLLEITETRRIQDWRTAQSSMLHLKRLGCQFGLDDFGTGFTSLNYLRLLPVEFVKMDCSFIQSVETDQFSRLIVKSMNEVAQSLGKMTVAECVENEESLALIRSMGIDFVQGHLFSPPRRMADYPWTGDS